MRPSVGTVQERVRQRRVWSVCLVVAMTACGGGGGGSGDTTGTGSGTGAMGVLAGNMGGMGNVDGTGSSARFWWPGASVVDAGGNLYVADTYNHVIRKVTPAGVVTVLAGIRGYAGASDGPAHQATFHGPGGLALDSAGNLYISDAGNFTVRKLSADGMVTTLAGAPGLPGDREGMGPEARFGDCWNSFGCELPGVAVDGQGNVFYGDTVNRVVRKITPSGAVTTFAGDFTVLDGRDGTGKAAGFDQPSQLALDKSANLYVMDRYRIRKITPDAGVTTLVGDRSGSFLVDGPVTIATVGPGAITLDASGQIFFADMANHAIRKITTDGQVVTVAGRAQQGSTDGAAAEARFTAPAGIAVNASGQLFVSDRANHTIRRIDPDGRVSTLAGLAQRAEPLDGVGGNAGFGMPTGIVAAADGAVYVADMDGNAVRRVTADGTTSTWAGALGMLNTADGVGANARMGWVTGLARGADGTLYVSDVYFHTIRKITRDGTVSTWAGSSFGFDDGLGARAKFAMPYGLAVDASGSVYVADTHGHTVRKITPDGMVSTLAGMPNFPGAADGTGTEARFNQPMDVAVDADGNVLVADEQNHAIRRITPNGVVTTLAGRLGQAGWRDGQGPRAGFYRPTGLTTAPDGTIYVADSWNHTIRKLRSDGTVTTVVGTAGLQGFQGEALPGVLSFPWRVAVRGEAMYITTARGVAYIAHRP